MSGLLLLLLLSSANQLPALDSSRSLNEYNLAGWRDGLPQQTVHEIVQTPDGYLWLATYEGVVRFDGIRFVVFRSESTPGIEHDAIYDLAVGRDGTLWVATAAGISRRRGAHFEVVLRSSDIDGRAVLAVEADGSGGVWAALGPRLVRWFQGEVIADLVGGEQLPEATIRTLELAPNGDLWAGFDSGVLTRIVTDRVVQTSAIPDGRSVLALASDESGVWAGTEGGNLYHRSVEGSGWTEPDRGSDRSGRGAVRTLLLDHGSNGDQTVWFGTDGGGVQRWSQGRLEVLDRRHGLESELVRSLWQDSEGSLWIGTNGGGLHALRDLRFATYNEADGLPHDNVRTILEDAQGGVWIGSDGGGLVRLESGEVVERFGQEELGSRLVKSLHQSPDGALWVGTEAGLVSIDQRRVVTRVGLSDGLPGAIVLAITTGADGTLWVGTNQGAARRAADESFSVFDRSSGLRDLNVMAFDADPDGSVWMGTLDGLYRWTPGGLEVFDETDGLPSARVFVLARDSESRLWVGTDRGLALHQVGEGGSRRFRPYGRQAGLQQERIFSIVDDHLGHLWTSSNYGVQRIARSDLERLERGEIERLTVTTFDRADGLPADQCNGTSQPSAWRTRSGRLWFATVMGAAVVDPGNLRRNGIAPPVVLETYSVDAVSSEIEGRIVVPATGRDLEIHYTALGLLSPENLTFRYRLAGFDPEWREVENRRVAYYTNLPPGEYTFEVTASNEDGLENPLGASVSVLVQPTLLETPMVRLALGMLLVIVPWVLYLLRGYRARRSRRRLENEVRLRTDELAQANRQLQRQTRLDGLTGVANRRSFDETLEREWRRAVRRQSSLAVLMIDIDAFKGYNDSQGHRAGDRALKAVAREISNCVQRAEDFVARYGGEEFVAILPDVSQEIALELAETLRAAIEGLEIAHPASPVASVLTVCVGVAWAPAAASGSPLTLVDHADQALYRAKSTGRNRTVLWERASN